ncbi:MAG: alpha-N-acetylglucosaminidase [Bacteroidales bacterium]|nr:alpha-N-acetylglucosaminidase [Bacteroidales bacterium]
MNKSHKIKITVLLLFLCAVLGPLCAQQAAEKLACRMLGRKAGARFEFVLRDTAASDYFILASHGKKIRITGNNDISVAMGLNYYLRHYAKVHVPWYRPVEPIRITDMPGIEQPVYKRAKVEDRFFLNYCTYGYTMPWWKWPQWEYFIDWMAMNGINMPLALTGQEAVWYEVWSEFGMSDEEIRGYFSGPAHLPWHRMANLDEFGGPLPEQWIQGQRLLQQQIVARERELGMRPVLGAFSGHVPKQLKTMFPQADIRPLSAWCGFEPTLFLSAEDSLFAVIQQKFLYHQTQMYGTDHIYSLDPFNEMDPPCWDTSYLANMAANIYTSLQLCDKQAKWMQMAWVFYYKRKQWTPDRLYAYLSAVPQGNLLMLDYFCEKTEVWRRSLHPVTGQKDGKKYGFYGQPYIWCYLGNFGGNTLLVGNINMLERKLQNLLDEAGDNLQGIGSTLEAFDCSEQIYDYLFERIWHDTFDVNAWTDDWAEMRLGASSNRIKIIWNMLNNSIYKDGAYYGKRVAMLNRPSMRVQENQAKNHYTYNNDILLSICKSMTEYAQRWKNLPESYRYDIVNLLSQWLGNYFEEVWNKFLTAYQYKDTSAMAEQIKTARLLFQDADTLLRCHPSFMLEPWLEDARSWGNTAQEKKYYEQQARTLLTIWGGPVLNDYAGRMWSGLVKSYYAQRWCLFFESVLESVRQGVLWDEKIFDAQLSQWEYEWTLRQDTLPYTSGGDALQVAAMILHHADSIYMSEKRKLTDFMTLFPAATLRDIYKTCFQDYFGPAHLVNDSDACARYIKQEIEQSDTLGGPWYCYTGVHGNYVCVNLQLVAQDIVPAPLLVSALMRSAAMQPLSDVKQWECRWRQLLPIAEQVLPPIPRYAADSAYIFQQLSQNNYAGRHSGIFNDTYHFHYRIVQKDIFETEILPYINQYLNRQ